MRGIIGQHIEMVDIRSQYLNIKDELDAAMEDVMVSAQYINGPAVKRFEASLSDFLDNTHVVTCANGTDALQLALMALQLQPGDEVIVPAFTYVSCVEVIALLNLVPVWVDVDPHTFNMDVSSMNEVITPNTKAVIVVHLFGQCAEMEELVAFTEENGLYLIEDVAQSLGAIYKFSDGLKAKAGTIGHIGCTSFFPSKMLGCFGDGGAVMTKSDEFAERIRMVANHGQRRKYHHDLVGVNSRLDTLQAAILDVKLQYIDNYIGSRIKAAEYYDELLAEVDWIERPYRDPKSLHVFNQYTVKVSNEIDRDCLKEYLHSKGVPTMIYYPLPLHKQQAYRSASSACYALPVSEALCDVVLSLPIHTELTDELQDYIIDALKSFEETF